MVSSTAHVTTRSLRLPVRCRPGLRNGRTPTRELPAREASALDCLVKRLQERLGSGREERIAEQLSVALERRIEALEAMAREDAAKALERVREQLVVCGHEPETMLDALAHACMAAKRTLSLEPRDGQRRAAIALLLGRFVEMPTGEGKTLATALAAVTTALDGTPVHVLTANDYLAERDATNLSPLYEAVGLTVDCVLPGMNDAARRKAYERNVVHLTGKQAGFDWMRDALLLGPDADSLVRRLGALTCPGGRRGSLPPLQRGLCSGILDEADSLLLDEARTPLVLAAQLTTGLAHEEEGGIALALARMLSSDCDFQLHRERREAVLTEVGVRTLDRLGERVPGVWQASRYRNERVRQALAALHLWERDRDYVVRDQAVLLVDEQSGRALPDRRLQHGLHGLIELKQHCRSTPESETVASIALQSFFLRYIRLVGTSGTLMESRNELAQTYGVCVSRIQPEHASRLTKLPARVFVSRVDQLDALIVETRRALASDRPVLVGTRSVEQSSGVGALLAAHDIPHRVLDASQDFDEAAIVAEAGTAGRVTVATNMAGRGTDIALGEDVARRGGLHLISLAFNDSRRVDRQLAGRTARQGDPGTFLQLWTLDDPALESALPSRLLGLMKRALDQNRYFPIIHSLALCIVRLAQRRIELRHSRHRRNAQAASKHIARHMALSGHPEHPA